MGHDRDERIAKIVAALNDLTEGQLGLVERTVSELRKPYIKLDRLPSSNIVGDCFLRRFGDLIRAHHCASKKPFTKDKVEYAIERTLKACGNKAELAPPGNPGHDITIDGIKVSLKTEAAKNTRPDKLWISKFMELGKGEWTDRIEDLEGLLDQFLAHLSSYERILSLRCLEKATTKGQWRYELVEIPTDLLEEARDGDLHFAERSTTIPKTGYCDVADGAGGYKFRLYFDGGGERKLQIKDIAKSYCIVHAEWLFSDQASSTDQQLALNL